MANYSIVVDTSNFKPFDLNAPLSILRDYRDAYYRYEDALNKIAEENGMYLLPTPDDSNPLQRAIYDQYAKYNNDFREISDDFAKGMNWKNALLVRDINRRYGLEAKPIKQAVENYNKFMENKNNIRANKDARFGKDPSIYDFVGGKVPQLLVKDAKDIQTGAAAIMKGLSSIIKDDPKVRQSIMEGYDLYMSGGLNQDNAKALVQALNDYNERTNYKHNDAVLNYMGALNKYYDSLGVLDWDESEKRKVWNDVVVGAMSAMPERKEELILKLDVERAYKKAATQLTYANIKKTQLEMYLNSIMFPISVDQARANVAHTRAQTNKTIEDTRASVYSRNRLLNSDLNQVTNDYNRAVNIFMHPNKYTPQLVRDAKKYIDTYNSINSTSSSTSTNSKGNLNLTSKYNNSGELTEVRYYVIPKQYTKNGKARLVKVNYKPEAQNPVEKIVDVEPIQNGSVLSNEEKTFIKDFREGKGVASKFYLNPADYQWVFNINDKNQSQIDAAGDALYKDFLEEVKKLTNMNLYQPWGMNSTTKFGSTDADITKQ